MYSVNVMFTNLFAQVTRQRSLVAEQQMLEQFKYQTSFVCGYCLSTRETNKKQFTPGMLNVALCAAVNQVMVYPQDTIKYTNTDDTH